MADLRPSSMLSGSPPPPPPFHTLPKNQSFSSSRPPPRRCRHSSNPGTSVAFPIKWKSRPYSEKGFGEIPRRKTPKREVCFLGEAAAHHIRATIWYHLGPCMPRIDKRMKKASLSFFPWREKSWPNQNIGPHGCKGKGCPHRSVWNSLISKTNIPWGK